MKPLMSKKLRSEIKITPKKLLVFFPSLILTLIYNIVKTLNNINGNFIDDMQKWSKQ